MNLSNRRWASVVVLISLGVGILANLGDAISTWDSIVNAVIKPLNIDPTQSPIIFNIFRWGLLVIVLTSMGLVAQRFNSLIADDRNNALDLSSIRLKYLKIRLADINQHTRTSLKGAKYITQESVEVLDVTSPVAYRDYSDVPRNFKSIVEAYKEFDNYLLVLGEPGTGKTLAVFILLKSVLEEAIQNSQRAIPILVNFSSYSLWQSKQGSSGFSSIGLNKKLSIENWVAEELANSYAIPAQISHLWLQEGNVAIFLDGIDEISAENRIEVIEAINSYIERARPWAIVLTSRLNEYYLLISENNYKVKLNGAVKLNSFSHNQIDSYLESANSTELLGVMTEDEGILELAQNPLFLNRLVVTLQTDNSYVTELSGQMTLIERRARLFETSLAAMMDRHARRQFAPKIHSESRNPDQIVQPKYSKKRVNDFLEWLALSLSERSVQGFRPEELYQLLIEKGFPEVFSIIQLTRYIVTFMFAYILSLSLETLSGTPISTGTLVALGYAAIIVLFNFPLLNYQRIVFWLFKKSYNQSFIVRQRRYDLNALAQLFVGAISIMPFADSFRLNIVVLLILSLLQLTTSYSLFGSIFAISLGVYLFSQLVDWINIEILPWREQKTEWEREIGTVEDIEDLLRQKIRSFYVQNNVVFTSEDEQDFDENFDRFIPKLVPFFRSFAAGILLLTLIRLLMWALFLPSAAITSYLITSLFNISGLTFTVVLIGSTILFDKNWTLGLFYIETESKGRTTNFQLAEFINDCLFGFLGGMVGAAYGDIWGIVLGSALGILLLKIFKIRHKLDRLVHQLILIPIIKALFWLSKAPIRYDQKFLNYLSEVSLLESRGNSYQFDHLLFQEHFALKTILDRLTSGDPLLRLDALEQLENLNETGYSTLQTVASNDPDPYVRRRAYLQLGWSRDISQFPFLSEAIEMEGDLYVREAIIITLGEFGARALEILTRISCEDPYANIRREAIVQIGEIGPVAAEALVDIAIHFNNDNETELAHDGLKAIGISAIPPLLFALMEHRKLPKVIDDLSSELFGTLWETLILTRSSSELKLAIDISITIEKIAPVFEWISYLIEQIEELLGQIEEEDDDPFIERCVLLLEQLRPFNNEPNITSIEGESE